jgi:hypothetical protein|tara:strand:+ start:207 stop:377 length:171 start_codon:yes stop_codon:yes gene_type:complete
MRQEIFDYLDNLCEKKKANLFEAPAIVSNKFKVNKSLARAIVAQWIAGKENFYKGG